ncbi:MAG TPA: hypothetical protein VF557_01720 [Jatrophihabitans sp.]|jgi:hypothetical protein|uniref:hypothetical protein n=1 Tax=Jatrophihabitans sp. TaxID=1932789 RepID=UPI002EF5A7AD
MPRAATLWTARGGWGKAVIAVAAVLAVAALCLVLLGTSQKQVQLGVLLGLWAALIAAFLVVDARDVQPVIEPAAELDRARARAAELHEAQLKVVASQQEQLEAARQAYFSQEIELRQFGELQHAREVSARRESELNLEVSLRREVERVLVEQLGSLREEVAELRAEVVDKLGGQLRLERIETTRVIGSDLEALQHEIRRLAASRTDSLAAPARAVAPAGAVAANGAGQSNGAARSGQDVSSDIVDAELVEFPPPATAVSPASPPPPANRMSEELRYQGRRRADGESAGWFARLDG